MLPRADISLTPVGRVDALPGVERVADPRQQAFERMLAGSLGKSLQGEILSRLTDGSFLVKVAGTPARMLLPEGAAVGQQVALTLVSLSPRPTFQIATQQGGQPALAYAEAGLPLPPGQEASRAAPLVYLDGGHAPAQPGSPATQAQSGNTPPGQAAASAAQAGAAAEAHADSAALVQRPLSYAAAQLARAPLIPAERLPAIDPGSTPATLNESARTIANLLAAPGARAPAALVAPTPLLPTPAAAPQQLAAALQQSLAESGLFYESHVAEWSAGERPLTSLTREPQMQRAAEADPAGPQAQAGAASASASLPGIDQDTAKFINLQLNTQEQGRVVWEGQPWPGQPMRWEVAKDLPERQANGGEGEPDTPWRSGLRLRFPLLGDIAATVVLHGGQLHIQVEAGSGGTGELLRAHAASLSDALDAAGLPLSSLNIRAGRADGDG